MSHGEMAVERQIMKQYAEEDARVEEANRQKAKAYQAEKEEYRLRYPAPILFDAKATEESPRPEVYPRIIAQLGGLIHVLRWAGWAGAYAVTDTPRERYVHPDTIRFWLPMPEAIDPPEGFYGTEE